MLGNGRDRGSYQLLVLDQCPTTMLLLADLRRILDPCDKTEQLG